MTAFFRDMAQNPLLAPGLVAGLLASIACGMIGPYVVTRRIVFLAGAIAHIAVGGVGAALFLRTVFPQGWGWLGPKAPLYGATLAALAAAVVMAFVHQRAGQHLDTLIGALWSVGMAGGILLGKFTPGYQGELFGYLFGNIAMVDWSDVRLLALLDGVIVLVVLAFHKRFLAICLDEEQAALQGVSVLGTHMVLLCLVALVVIALTQIVGLILVIALLSLPAAAAACFVVRMGPLLGASVGLCAVLVTVPRLAVYGTRIGPESAVVLAAAAVYLLALVIARIRTGHKAA